MAIQRKGILGPPKGKIGNIHFYDRHGINIVQKNSIPNDSFLRYWNLYKSQVLANATLIYNSFTANIRNLWIAETPVGMATVDYYTSLALARVLENKSNPFGDILFRPAYAQSLLDVRTEGVYIDRFISIMIPPANSFWHNITEVNIVLQYFRVGVYINNKSFTIPTTGYQPININFSSGFPGSTRFIEVFISKNGSTIQYGGYFPTVYNPLFIS